jgi:hypothetical protein
MQFGAYSDDGYKLKDPIEQVSSSSCVNNLKQSGLSASAPFVQMVQNIGVTWRNGKRYQLTFFLSLTVRSYVFLVGS